MVSIRAEMVEDMELPWSEIVIPLMKMASDCRGIYRVEMVC